MQIAPYDPGRDLQAAQRIWQEIGWASPDNARESEVLKAALTAGRALVGRIGDVAECLVTDAKGTLRHLTEDIPMVGMTSVATSYVARKRGLAGRVTARMLAEGAAGGAEVAALGVFDQGFYNRLGFGSGPYEHWVHLNPKMLRVAVPSALPVRLGDDDWKEIHECRTRRLRRHGAVTFAPAELTRADMMEPPRGFGLGFRREADGLLTHMVWLRAENMEEGPYTVGFMAYENTAQLREVLGIIKSLEDQVNEVQLAEPAGVQIQDLAVRPHHAKSARVFANADWQLRLLDVPGCVARTHLACAEVRLNLVLTDPVAAFLPDKAPWRGVAGEYVLSLGSDCSAEPGSDPGLPALRASVGAFSRLWYGVRPASGLALTDDMSGSPELLAALDQAFSLPRPSWDWQF
jgi:hypothetical protein